MLLKTNIISIANLFHFVNSKTKQPTMNWRKYARLTLLLVAFSMLLYQSHKAFELLMNPPMIETTSETSIKNVRQPMMYLCPSVQYNIADYNYSSEKCVDDYVSNDLKTMLGCIPPLLSNHDHCGFVTKEKFSDFSILAVF